MIRKSGFGGLFWVGPKDLVFLADIVADQEATNLLPKRKRKKLEFDNANPSLVGDCKPITVSRF